MIRTDCGLPLSHSCHHDLGLAGIGGQGKGTLRIPEHRRQAAVKQQVFRSISVFIDIEHCTDVCKRCIAGICYGGLQILITVYCTVETVDCRVSRRNLTHAVITVVLVITVLPHKSKRRHDLERRSGSVGSLSRSVEQRTVLLVRVQT